MSFLTVGVGGTEGDRVFFGFLLQMMLILAVSHGLGRIAIHAHQPRAVGEMIAGLVLGPSLLGWIFPEVFRGVFVEIPLLPVEVVSQIGLVLLMFQVGLDFDVDHLKGGRWSVVAAVSGVGMILPFLLGGMWGWLSWETLHPTGDRLLYVIFLGIGLSITAMPILARILMEFDLHRSRIGVIAIACAAVKDWVAWILLATACGLAARGVVAAPSWKIFLGLIGFAAAGWWLVGPLFRRALDRVEPGGELRTGRLALALMMIFFFSWISKVLGIFTLFGGFFAGLLLHRAHGFARAWRHQVSGFVNVFFVPVFFTISGLRTDLPGLSSIQLWGWFFGLLIIAVLGKFGGCYWAARHTGVTHPEAMTIGALMNTRGLMELIVANVALDFGAISRPVFTMIVLMAIVTTLMTGPILTELLRKSPELRN